MKRRIGYFLPFIFLLLLLSLTAFADSGTVTLPQGLKKIEAETFMGDKAVKTVVVPDGVTSIGARAFANSGVTQVYLPTSIKSISVSAFSGCANVTCYGADDIYAQEWCAANGVDYVVMTSAVGVSTAKSSNVVQSFYDFAPDALSINSQNTENSDSTYDSYSGDQSDLELVRAYVNALAAPGTNLTLLGDGTSKAGFGYCWTFAYTGTAKTTTSFTNIYNSSLTGQVEVWIYSQWTSKTNVFIKIAKGLTFGDLGLRLTEDMGYMTSTDMWKLSPYLQSAAQVGDDAVRLTWTPQGAAKYYSVYEIKGGTITWIATTTDTIATLTGVSFGKHTYAVRGRSSASTNCEYGAYSNTVTVTVEGEYALPQDNASLTVQDIRPFAADALSIPDYPSVYQDYTVIGFECTENDLWIMDEYVAMLTSGRYNFKLKYKWTSDTAVSGDWLLTYTGSGTTGPAIAAQHNDKHSGDVSIWYYMPSPYGTRTVKVFIYIAGGLKESGKSATYGLRFGDLGLRSDGSVADVQPAEVRSGTKSNVVQDIRFFDTSLSYGDEQTYADSALIPFSGTKAQISNITNYISRLTGSGTNFVLNEYYKSNVGEFYSWSINYVGKADVGEKLEQLFTTGYYGHVTLYAIVDGSRMSGQMYICEGLVFGDMGMRASGGDVTISRPGTSSSATLKKSGSTYSTSDGRLSTTVGKAQIIRGGTKYSTSKVSVTRSTKSGQDKFLVNGYNGNECIALTLPNGGYKTGTAFNAKQLGLSASAKYTINTQAAFFHYIWKTSLGTVHGDQYLMLHYPPQNAFKDALVRVMLWDESADVAVIYVACEYTTKPYEVECLLAFKISSAIDGDDDSEKLSLSTGGIRTLTFSNTFYDSLSETYKWEIVSGGGVVSLSGTVGKSTTVKALKKGTAVVRCTYDYSYYTTDALGVSNKYYGFASRTQDFTITVG